MSLSLAVREENRWLFPFWLINWNPYARARAHPSQGWGRAKIIVELKSEVPFEIVPGSRGGARVKIAGVSPALAPADRSITSASFGLV